MSAIARLLMFVGFAPLVLAASAPADADKPQISKPRPVPEGTPVDVPPLPPAALDQKLDIGGEDVKAHSSNTRLSVEVRLNGRGPYRFLVDSGADTSVVGLRIANDLELPLGTPAILNSTTARHFVDRVKVDTLDIGSSSIRDLQMPALRERDVGGDGLIGIDALVRQRLMMDFEKKVIKVEDARVPRRSEPGEIVITARRQRGQLILTQVQAGDTALDAVIDTGSEVTIGNRALRDKLFRNSKNRGWIVPATGVTGVTVNMQMTVIPRLQIGPVTLFDVPVAFADVPPFKLFGLDEEPALLLGTDLLETFRRVSLDFRARKVRFQLRSCSDNAVYLSTSPSRMATRIKPKGMIDAC